MDLNTFCNIDTIVRKYTGAFAIYNRYPDMALTLECRVTEEDKEHILNELDLNLPLDTYFSHIYENGELQVIFKEVI